jgi:hypothetical protein
LSDSEAGRVLFVDRGFSLVVEGEHSMA